MVVHLLDFLTIWLFNLDLPVIAKVFVLLPLFGI